MVYTPPLPDKVDSNLSHFFTGVGPKRLYCSLYTARDITNCKLSYIHGAGSLHTIPDEYKKEIIDKLLNSLLGYVILTTIIKSVADWVTKTYPTYYMIAVPVGYNEGFQYNVCFKNTINLNHDCLVPERTLIIDSLNTVPEQKAKIDKEEIKKKLKAVLKKYKRKSDYVEEFLESL